MINGCYLFRYVFNILKIQQKNLFYDIISMLKKLGYFIFTERGYCYTNVFGYAIDYGILIMNIYFVGIGGVSMSGLAEIALANGHNVFGSDLQMSNSIKRLVEKGAIVYSNHDKANITNELDLVVYTAAVKEDNPEYMEALSKGIKLQNRAQFLGDLMKSYKNAISIAGTHGKTTTTSMVSSIFKYGNYDPTILVGGNLNIINGNVNVGKTDYFITEACEYTNSFLNFNSKVAIVLNIEADHLDYFSGLDEIKESFNKFGKLLPKEGFFIVNGDDVNTKDIDKGVLATVIRFGKGSHNDAIFNVISYDEKGCARYTLSYKGVDLGEFKISVPGEHNAYNSVSAILSAYVLGLDIEDIRENIALYTGVGRRFEFKGTFGENIKVIDDYAHHPTEIKATLKAAQNMKNGKVWAIFQPHTYSRTITLLDEFANAFHDADNVIIPDIYASREKFTTEVSSKDLCDRIQCSFDKSSSNLDKTVNYIPELKDVVDYIQSNAKENDLVLTIGAGDVYKVAEELVK